MLSFLNKKFRDNILFKLDKGLIGAKVKNIFKFAKIFYSKIYTPDATKPIKGKLLIISEVGGLETLFSLEEPWKR